MKNCLQSVAANHRANDVIVREGVPQILVARFMYSPIDVIALTGEKVDIHIMRDAPAGEWTYLSTEVTDKNGKIVYKIPDEKALGYGLYPIKMVVRYVFSRKIFISFLYSHFSLYLYFKYLISLRNFKYF